MISFIIDVENNGNSKIDGFTVQDNLSSRLGNINLTPGSPSGLNVTYQGIIEPVVVPPPSSPTNSYVLNIGEMARFTAKAIKSIKMQSMEGDFKYIYSNYSIR